MGWVEAGTCCVTIAEDNVRDMLTNTTAFQQWVGVVGPVQARPFVFFHAIPNPDSTRWPELSETFSVEFFRSLQNYALLYTAPVDGFSYEYSAAPNEFLGAGIITVEFMRYWENDGDERLDEHTREALNEIGTIIHSVGNLAGTAGYPSVNGFECLEMDWEPEDQQPDTGRYFRMTWDINWSSGNNQAGG